MAVLEYAYEARDLDLLASFLASDPTTNAQFVFRFESPATGEQAHWDLDEEIRLHRRMFHPESTAPDERPVGTELWLQDVILTLTPLEPFQERPDLYSANGGVDGKLDPHRWRAVEARYSTYIYFDLTGPDYEVEGEANFVVIEDLAKQVGDAGKFLLYIWEDLLPFVPLDARISYSEYTSWGMIKTLYR